MSSTAIGRVVALAIKREKGTPLEEVDAVEVSEEGISGNIPQKDYRRITLINKGDWEAAQADIEGDRPWQTRRANILVEGLNMAELLNREIAIGPVRLLINGETKPCGLMDELQPGLRQALTPDCRGGVYGSVLEGGTISTDETIELLEESK